MSKDEIASFVLAALGGKENILTNTVCMTRLRVTLKEPSAVNYDLLNEIGCVLGTVTRGRNGLEVVFGPRIIDEVYHSFISLTGRAAGSDALFPMSRPDSSIRVTISRIPKREEEPQRVHTGDSLFDESEMGILEGIFSDKKEAAEQPEAAGDENSLGKLLVVNGPNSNLLGLDERAHAQWHDFPSLLSVCKDTAHEMGFSRCDCVQSNHEGDLIDLIQDAWCTYEGIVINPTGYGDSRGVRDAIRQVGIPTVEVHLHEQDEPDEVAAACQDTVGGKGTDGYREAIICLADYLIA